ncbi:hypothetical protein ACFSUS_04135 [Spirosoma soli]|uniref:Lipocalin-like domain-containing protein n=1 Tax=Spirosoma soli TaxID=1770529 RepID=A0ABW5LYF6_9BACT
MTHIKRLSFFSGMLLIGLWGCSQEDAQPTPNPSIVGSWLFVEYGYSPGAGYIVKKAPLIPPQAVSFTAQGEVATVNMGKSALAQARTYRIDSTRYGTYLIILDSTQRQIGYSLFVSIRNDTLRLSPPCIEGCHSGYVRIR